MDNLDDASDDTSLVRGKAFIDYMRESLVGRKFGEEKVWRIYSFEVFGGKKVWRINRSAKGLL